MLANGLRKISTLHDALHRDTEFWLREFQAEAAKSASGVANYEEAGFCLKSAVRTFLAEIDGTAYAMRRMVLSVERHAEIEISDKDRIKLKGGRDDEIDLASGKDVVST